MEPRIGSGIRRGSSAARDSLRNALSPFLSAFLKIERLELIREFFGGAPIVIPAEVTEEIARAGLLAEMIEARAIQVEMPLSGEAREFLES